MTLRMLSGRRSSGVYGLWVSFPGYDADTANDDQLMLGITQYTEQLVMIGSTTSLPATVLFGYTNVPCVFLTSTNLTVNIGQGSGNDYNGNYSSVSGLFMRPYPPIGSTAKKVQASVTSASMYIYAPNNDVSVAGYAVYRRRSA